MNSPRPQTPPQFPTNARGVIQFTDVNAKAKFIEGLASNSGFMVALTESLIHQIDDQHRFALAIGAKVEMGLLATQIQSLKMTLREQANTYSTDQAWYHQMLAQYRQTGNLDAFEFA